MTGLEGGQVVLLLEDHQFVDSAFLELINSLLSSGEVPGLYTPEELEPLLSSLKDTASQEDFRGSLLSYFASRVRANLRIVLIMDSSAPNFIKNCESNPAFYTQCSFQSMEGWSRESMISIPTMVLATPQSKRDTSDLSRLPKLFLQVHDTCLLAGATPRHYLSFLATYRDVYTSKRQGVQKQQNHLQVGVCVSLIVIFLIRISAQAGVAKLNETKEMVDKLKQKAAHQSTLLAEKQDEADLALKEITASMQVTEGAYNFWQCVLGIPLTFMRPTFTTFVQRASEQRNEMETVKQKISEESLKLEQRKKAIDIELSEIEPLVVQTRQAVGNIKPESLSEIRSLRAPPDVIRDILEGVLRLMGIYDTSWNSMKRCRDC